jgi:hypothetical protein
MSLAMIVLGIFFAGPCLSGGAEKIQYVQMEVLDAKRSNMN